MTTILKNIQSAWFGWKNYTDDGKLAALLLVSLFFLWHYRKNIKSASFLGYTIIMTICCICPVTAGLLMVYQTKFYDYEWIWSLVPVTAVIAYGVTFLLAGCWDGSPEGRGGLKKDRCRASNERSGSVGGRDGAASGRNGAAESRGGWAKCQGRLRNASRGIPVTGLVLAVILLAGGMGRPSWNRKEQAIERERAYLILDQIMELCPNGEMCLWAPREIMAYAREWDSHIRLPYGRNMWDISLNAYAYDVYDERTTALYEWMEQAWKADSSSLEICVQYAQAAGVDCVVLPETVSQEIIQRMETALHTEARLLEGYWIFYGRAD